MSKILNHVSDTLIYVSFHLLFFFVPLFFLPYNFELFEYNKMMAVYFLASFILGSWLVKSLTEKKFQIAKTPLDIPLFLFFFSQILSTVFSIDPHVSLFGYYSRFNGGLLSIATYIFLYYAFVTNISREKLFPFLRTAFVSGIMVAVWGIFEHFGHSTSCLIIQGKFSVSCWVQDVKTRVFATLGQPNWLAAYMAVLVLPALGKGFGWIKTQSANQEAPFKIKNLAYISLSLLFFITLLFTKSKSGFLGSAISLLLFFVLLLIRLKKKIITPALSVLFFLLAICFIFGTSFSFLDQFSLPQLSRTTKSTEQVKNVPSSEGLLESGITGSDQIRRIVWKGAIDIFKAYPIVGSGVETFAFSYYRFRPVEHNMTSEWDFLYNKAHNEYLNYLATTGIIGFASYMVFIASVLLAGFKISGRDGHLDILDLSLLCGWISILITNFFGFSVVVVQVFFYLIPAMLIVSKSHLSYRKIKLPDLTLSSPLGIFLSVSFTIFLLFSVVRGWIADYYYADGYHASRSNEYTRAYNSLKTALSLNSGEPVYYDEFSYIAATLAVGLSEEKDKTLSESLIQEAIIASNQAITTSPSNVNFWKSRTRVFYTLSQLDPQYLDTALSAIEKSSTLSPTDPKVRYNLALIYDGKDKKEEAIKEIKEAVRLKPDYREAYIAEALLYSKYGDKEKASASAQFVLDRIDPNDADAKKVIEDLK